MQVTALGKTLIVGQAFGSIRMFHLVHGTPLSTPAAGDHAAQVTSVRASPFLRLFLTCSLDGSIKLFDEMKRLVQGMAMEAPITCCAFLNTRGDILAGACSRL